MQIDVLDEFLRMYRRQFDYYHRAAQLCAAHCQENLQQAGIRAIVTARAKQFRSLEKKCTARRSVRTYSSVAQIFDDVVDLAGVRIALYFPGDFDKVRTIIERMFSVHRVKEFPRDGHDRSNETYAPAFSGYKATHFHIFMDPLTLSEDDKRFSECRVEVQLASVLMHAWAEVEHDLAYKPETGDLSLEEYAVLDELNGLVLSGEIGLSSLQRAVDRRTALHDRAFNDHYELASFLYQSVRSKFPADREPLMGRADVLLAFLRENDLATSASLQKYLSQLPLTSQEQDELDDRPIIEQVAELILSERPDLASSYFSATIRAGTQNPYASATETYGQDILTLTGWMLALWATFEAAVRTAFQADSSGRPFLLTNRTYEQLVSMGLIDPPQLQMLHRIRLLKNRVIHGIAVPETDDLLAAGTDLQQILEKMASSGRGDVRDTILTRHVEPPEIARNQSAGK